MMRRFACSQSIGESSCDIDMYVSETASTICLLCVRAYIIRVAVASSALELNTSYCSPISC
jgi:hypothetical protein